MRTRRSPVVVPWGPAARRSLLRRTALEEPAQSDQNPHLTARQDGRSLIRASVLPPALALALVLAEGASWNARARSRPLRKVSLALLPFVASVVLIWAARVATRGASE